MTTTTAEPTIHGKAPATVPAIDRSALAALTEAVQRYFDLMYDCDVSRFNTVFRSSVHLHGFRDGKMVAWPAETYKDILAKRTSPKSLGAARADEILMVDFASPTQALTKLRVRIAAMQFVDYLTWHRIDGKWLITSKGFHVESGEAAGIL
jgi:hypothetical protein